MAWLRKYLDTVIAPLALAGLYAWLMYNSQASRLAAVVAAMFFVAIIMLWFGVRRLRIHASASRLAAIDRPDELLELVERELPVRLTAGTRAPMHVFAAMAHNLKGDAAAARRSLDVAGIVPGSKALRSWQFLWAAADIHARTAIGDLAGARATFAKGIAPLRPMASGGIELVIIEAEARIKLAAGDGHGARDLLAPLLKDVRLGPGARAQLKVLSDKAAAAAGDAEVPSSG
jgi:hypothetical protein